LSVPARGLAKSFSSGARQLRTWVIATSVAVPFPSRSGYHGRRAGGSRACAVGV